MIKINCIAIDDECLGLELVKNHIQAIPFLNLVGVCRNVHEAMDILQNEKIDLIFSDIEMPDINGIQFLKSLSHPPMTIFITAFHQYALDGYNLNLVDYLLKPVSFDRFLLASNKALELFLSRRRVDLPYDSQKSVDSNPGYLFVTSDYSLVKIRLDDVTHIEGLKDYLKIYFTNQANPVLTRMTMKALEERLPPRKFFRVHKSYIVAIDKIEFIRSQRIKIGPHLVPISNSHYEVFRQKVNI
jgi:DNA-binding LytR/AlgR family response regulator